MTSKVKPRTVNNSKWAGRTSYTGSLATNRTGATAIIARQAFAHSDFGRRIV